MRRRKIDNVLGANGLELGSTAVADCQVGFDPIGDRVAKLDSQGMSRQLEAGRVLREQGPRRCRLLQRLGAPTTTDEVIQDLGPLCLLQGSVEEERQIPDDFFARQRVSSTFIYLVDAAGSLFQIFFSINVWRRSRAFCLQRKTLRRKAPSEICRASLISR